MEQTLQIILEFNAEASRILLKKYFKYIWKKGVKAIIRTLLYVTGFGFLFSLTAIGKTSSGLDYIFGCILIFMLSILYLQTFQYFFSRKKYYKSIETHFKEQEAQGITQTILLLDDNSISLKDKTFEIKALWSKITYFYIDNDTLGISFNISNKILFLIDIKERSETIVELIHRLENRSTIERH